MQDYPTSAKIWGIFLVIFSLSWAGCGSKPAPQDSESSPSASSSLDRIYPTFETLTVSPVSMERKVAVTGRLQPLEKIEVVSEVQGKVLPMKRLMNEGVRYRKGDTLFQLDAKQFALDLNSQKSQFQASLVRIMSQIQLDFPTEHPQWDAYLKDFQENHPLKVLPEVKDESLKYLLSANNIYAQFYGIKSAEERLTKYTVTTPFSGIITQGQVSQGAIINPGVPLATLSRTDVFEMKAAISSAFIKLFRTGQVISLTHSNTGETWKGRVSRLGGNLDPATQSIPVFIRVSGRGLKEGMFLETEIDAASFEGVVALPLDALTRNNQVHVIKDSTVVLQDVSPVNFESNQVWVKGLKEGEEVIVESVLEPIVGIKALSQS